MNATLIDGGKVHRLAGLAARCGVGKDRDRPQWQTDLGDITCLRCLKAKPYDENAKKVSTTDCTDGRG